MKALLRLRRLAIKQPRTDACCYPSRLASTAAASSSTESLKPHEPALESVNPPPVASSSRQTDFFTSAYRPLLQLSAARPTSSSLPDQEAARLSSLNHELNCPRHHRDSYQAAKIWQIYESLSTSTRRSLPPDTLRKVLRGVVSARISLEGMNEGKRSRSSRNLARTSERYERRFQTIMQDMRLCSSHSGEDHLPDVHDYTFVLHRLARLGSSTACEGIYIEMPRRKGRELIKLLDMRLLALLRQLQMTKDQGKTIGQAQQSTILRILWDVVEEHRHPDIVPRRLTITLLLQNVRLAQDVIRAGPDSAGASLDELLEEVFRKAFGLDLRYFTIDPSSSHVTMHALALRMLLDYLGRKGDVWRMISAFELLSQPGGWEVEAYRGFDEEDGEEDSGPTLSQMEAQEAETRRGLGWFNMGRTAPVTGERDLPPHMDPQPTSSSSTTRAFSDFLPALTGSSDVASPSVAASSPIRTDVFTILLQHACAAGDRRLALHALATAIQTTRETRLHWLAGVLQHAEEAYEPSVAESAGSPDPDAVSEDMSDLTPPSAEPTATPTTPLLRVAGPRLAVAEEWFQPVRRLLSQPGTSITEKRRYSALLEQALSLIQEEEAVLAGPLRAAVAPPTPTNPEAGLSAEAGSSWPVTAEPTSPAPLLAEIFDLTSHLRVLANTLSVIRFYHDRAQATTASHVARKRRLNATRQLRAEQGVEAAEAASLAEAHRKDERERRRREKLGVGMKRGDDAEDAAISRMGSEWCSGENRDDSLRLFAVA